MGGGCILQTNVTSSLLVTRGHLLLCVQDVHHFCFKTFGLALDFKKGKNFFNKYNRLPWHDANVCEKVFEDSISLFRFL